MRSTQQNDERPGDINPASSATYAEHSRCSPRCDACSSSPSFSSRARLICSEVPPRSLSRKELLRDAGVEEAPPHRLVEALRPLRAAVRLPAARAPHAEPRKDKVDPPAEDWAMDPAHRTAQHNQRKPLEVVLVLYLPRRRNAVPLHNDPVQERFKPQRNALLPHNVP